MTPVNSSLVLVMEALILRGGELGVTKAEFFTAEPGGRLRIRIYSVIISYEVNLTYRCCR